MNNRVFKLLIFFAAAIFLMLLYFFADARHSNIFPHCIFHSITGLYCPGCGSQRAISALLHEDVISAIHFNILLVASLPLLIYSAIVFCLNTFGKSKIVPKFFYSAIFARLVGITIILFWILRNIPVYPFNLLAPKE